MTLPYHTLRQYRAFTCSLCAWLSFHTNAECRRRGVLGHKHELHDCVPSVWTCGSHPALTESGRPDRFGSRRLCGAGGKPSSPRRRQPLFWDLATAIAVCGRRYDALNPESSRANITWSDWLVSASEACQLARMDLRADAIGRYNLVYEVSSVTDQCAQ